jgi:uncharacterized protein YceH (UPF0502 family)
MQIVSMEPNTLSAAEVRVLGSLIEKQITTPDYYPLTLNALTNACNQTSNRDPVVAFDESTIVRALDALREKRLALLFDGATSRVPKYAHKFDETLGLARPEVAALAVLFLRGPQTAGEVRGRTGRMHEFATIDDSEATLRGLAEQAPPLVVKLPRQTGFKESRYAHLLSGPAVLDPADTAPRPEPATIAVRFENERLAKLEAETEALRREIADLRQELADFKRQFG